jgi:AcrR family transcriptional regulator
MRANGTQPRVTRHAREAQHEASVRERLLTAALQVYANAGRRGATTRRIAQEAGVNEVTLFRHFGSKEALLRQAVSSTSEGVVVARLPEHPTDPERELTDWCRLHHQFLFSIRSFIRTSIAESVACPDQTTEVAKLPIKVANELHAYLMRLRADGLVDEDWNARAATSMLMGALFADATQRDVMPERYPYSPQDAVRHYVRLFLRAIGFVRGTAAAEPARRRHRRTGQARHV